MTEPDPSTSEATAEATDAAPDEDLLREAFIAGFVTGRTGRYYGHVDAVSKRAAASKFELYYEHNFK